MRGAPSFHGCPMDGHGIIPADAGSTVIRDLGISELEDHPRGCGEHTYNQGKTGQVRGSSPRMRGAHHTGSQAGLIHGIIPADAGSTSDSLRAWTLTRDHPRGCGEHAGRKGNKVLRQGSSPRMRVAQFLTRLIHRIMRIIPADAGSTPVELLPIGPPEDHPRGCGEHSVMSSPFRQVRGSSPRMRGARPRFCPKARCPRIIPADAGSTPWYLPSAGLYTDHPRGCGEHRSIETDSSRHRGSSPRMRGALPFELSQGRDARIIPADAGSTCW